jgi:23S rRNA (cytidine1920-2'-O)/16S rRNA (cytidine1409-2'-O)-methyltransferase
MTTRLDVAMVERGLVPSRNKAQALILAGVVRVNDRPVQKAGEPVADDEIIFISEGARFVSRGGEKLEHALTEFDIDLSRRVCADIGASTGGFTDAMLQGGAARVFAIDVGYGQIALELRNDPRVTVMDRTNARYLESLDEPVEFTAIDASFISLSKLFPAVVRISAENASLVALIKPQFEAGKNEVGKKGVVRDNAIHRRILAETIESAASNDLHLAGLTASPLKGPAGNIEFLGYFEKDLTAPTVDVSSAIESAIEGAPK